MMRKARSLTKPNPTMNVSQLISSVQSAKRENVWAGMVMEQFIICWRQIVKETERAKWRTFEEKGEKQPGRFVARNPRNSTTDLFGQAALTLSVRLSRTESFKHPACQVFGFIHPLGEIYFPPRNFASVAR